MLCPDAKKSVSHPLERIIKDKFSKHLKYVHNSVNNPKYPQIPKKKEKNVTPNIRKCDFTIYGCRTNQAFIHCVHLINGLYKYKPQDINAPVIRGVTGVEWPTLLKDLQSSYGDLLYCLKDPVVVFINGEVLGGLKELKEIMEAKYNYYLTLDFYKLSVESFAKFIKVFNRPCAYMHISLDEEHIGTLIFMLYADIVPLTSENFLRLCATTRGGYSGTPIHRVVKNGWIQGGGFGLKNTQLDCENFIVPHDHRGVLAMANAERHVDCSTQFFVLLQPAPWMAYNYVAFGQLIDGEETLQKIENVETFYESPKSKIRIDKAGILNLDCHNIAINKRTNEYIQSHIEDLIDLAKTFWEEIMKNVFESIKLKDNELIEKYEAVEDFGRSDVHATRRFLHTADHGKDKSMDEDKYSENNEFAVDSYVYEGDDFNYSQVTPSLIVPDVEPYYIPLTDVPYPGDVDSTYDLKKFLRGDYCLESDLKTDESQNIIKLNMQTYDPAQIFFDDISSEGSIESLNSDDAKEVKQYLKFNSDKVSFSGKTVLSMVKNDVNTNIENAKLFIFTDDGLRKLRLFTRETKAHNKKVSMSVDMPMRPGPHNVIKRRPTGFIRNLNDPELLPSASDRSFDNTSSRKVRIVDKSMKEKHKISVMKRLFEEAIGLNQYALRDYRSDSTRHDKFALMSYSPIFPSKSERSPSQEEEAMSQNERIVRLQPEGTVENPKASRLPRSSLKNDKGSIRAHEYARMRPKLSINQYQLKIKNDLSLSEPDSKLKDLFQTTRNIGLPGDSPLSSETSMGDNM